MRLGGDEFVVLLAADIDEAAGLRVAHRIVDAINDPFVIGDQVVRVGASIGLAVSNADRTGAQLVAAADRGAYEAKNNGRNGVAVVEGTVPANGPNARP